MPANLPQKPVPPLSPAVFHILLALVDGERHGYSIMQAVESDTAGALKLGPGTLYGCLKRMLSAGLVEESEERPDPDLDDERRRYYRATDTGLRAVRAELARLAAIVSVAQAKKWLPRNRSVLAGPSR
ncbi:PadR family transcriptional regulator [Dyella choica]|uniref:PadR family transcriptional regulator n=1 Tax=Dyella choica TaxID=1927959 RepID=A0A3S0PIC7_9GAMM|nr:PadR family transcriptional regulator [Dyella choica]RUL69006.1 PadR family transcriptional regulator [Dyella choica]